MCILAKLCLLFLSLLLCNAARIPIVYVGELTPATTTPTTTTIITTTTSTTITSTTTTSTTPTPTPTPSYKPGWCGIHVTQLTGVCFPKVFKCRSNRFDIKVYDAAHEHVGGTTQEWRGKELILIFHPIRGLYPTNKEMKIDIYSPPLTDQKTHHLSFTYGDDRWDIHGLSGARLPWGAGKTDRCSVGMYDPGDGTRTTWIRQIDCGFMC